MGTSDNEVLAPNNHIQLTWTDLSNITRCQVVTRHMFEFYFKTKGASLGENVLTLPYVRGGPVLLRPVQVTLMPDVSSLRSIDPWAPQGQLCFGTLRNDDGQASPYCARSFLIRQAELLREAEIDLTIGFELEFFLLNADLSPVDASVYCETKSFHGDSWRIMTEIVNSLCGLGIPVWRYHSEAGAGQFEISIGPFLATEGSVVKAADGLVMARETIYHIAAKHGKKATFVPKPFGGLTSGAHAHFGLQHGSKNLFEVKPSPANAFLAGVLDNLPNLMLILAPTGNSYERLKPLSFSGVYQCMGTENKEAALRLVKDESGTLTRFEVKPGDGTSNPYLMVGSIIAAGLHGIREMTMLPPEVAGDPSSLPISQQPPLLPTMLPEAIDVFEKSGVSREIFGEEMHSLLLKLRRKELEHWESTEVSKESKIKVMIERF